MEGLEGVLRDPGFGRNRARDSGIQKNPAVIRECYIGCDAGFSFSVVRDS